MTGEQLVARAKATLESLYETGVDEGVPVADLREHRRLRDLDATIYNYLGLRDPVEVGRWIIDAMGEIALSRVDPDKS